MMSDYGKHNHLFGILFFLIFHFFQYNVLRQIIIFIEISEENIQNIMYELLICNWTKGFLFVFHFFNSLIESSKSFKCIYFLINLRDY